MKKYFECDNCGKKVDINAPGTKHRNHCPFCLYSVHVDLKTGDRRSKCFGMMEPLGKYYKKDGEEMLVHRCMICGFIRRNRVAGDDSIDVVAELKIIDTELM